MKNEKFDYNPTLVISRHQNKENAIYYTTTTETLFTGNSETLGRY
jgi:hypothetical protein